MQYNAFADNALGSNLILLRKKYLWRDVEFWSLLSDSILRWRFKAQK